MKPHFNLNNNDAYQAWREQKLASYPINLQQHFIEIANAKSIDAKSLQRITQSCQQINIAFYRFIRKPRNEKKWVHVLGKQVGLLNLDNNLCADNDYLTSLCVTKHKGQHDYIPYTNKRLSWHTDGYYNKPNEQIRGMLLHCSRPAKNGGESLLLDHEILYILLRDENPNYIAALQQEHAMTIPPNILRGKEVRPARTGSVFSFDQAGNLHMRYSARLKNIEWAKDKDTQAAVNFIRQLWEREDSPYILRYTLQAGEGLICNNVLHRRTDFEDDDRIEYKRLLYRGRYYDRVNSLQSLYPHQTCR